LESHYSLTQVTKYLSISKLVEESKRSKIWE